MALQQMKGHAQGQSTGGQVSSRGHGQVKAMPMAVAMAKPGSSLPVRPLRGWGHCWPQPLQNSMSKVRAKFVAVAGAKANAWPRPKGKAKAKRLAKALTS